MGRDPWRNSCRDRDKKNFLVRTDRATARPRGPRGGLEAARRTLPPARGVRRVRSRGRSRRIAPNGKH